MEILLGYGLPGLPFGSSRETVRAVLGEPDEIAHDSYLSDGSEPYEEWLFQDRLLTLTFDAEDRYVFGSATLEAPSTTLEGFPIVGASVHDVLQFLGESLHWALRLEEDDHLVSVPEQSLHIWIEDDAVRTVTWWYHFIDDDTPRWPDQEQSKPQ